MGPTLPGMGVTSVVPSAAVHQQYTDPHHHDTYTPNTSSDDAGVGGDHAPDGAEGHDDQHNYDDDDSITDKEPSVDDEVAEEDVEGDDIPIPQHQRPPTNITSIPSLNICLLYTSPSPRDS
eukprot:TRINITY_DN27906_c0_g1_i1.p1 TRINITY_DN27906_c0_g1~~TRINITY_DN27906_c0_g1_i1.p1  ORF type:complete len:121 (+),score=28.60 TRINITY_DN27906_c0_g1_i1:200-562(+)